MAKTTMTKQSITKLAVALENDSPKSTFINVKIKTYTITKHMNNQIFVWVNTPFHHDDEAEGARLACTNRGAYVGWVNDGVGPGRMVAT
jgi:hypothetical protein